MSMTINDKVIGSHIKAARSKAHLTQARMADALDVSVSYYSRIECGDVRVNLERLFEICTILKVHPHAVLAHSCEELESIEDIPEDDPHIKNVVKLMHSAAPETRKTLAAVCAAVYKQLEQKESITKKERP